MKYSRTDIDALPSRERAHLINNISGFKSANLIGTQSVKGTTNVAVFSSVMHFGASPPVIGFVLRPTTVERNTYNNILETDYYTINSIHKSIIVDAHHTSAKYPKEISEFSKTALKEQYHPSFPAPFVKDSPVQIGLKFLEEHAMAFNGTRLILGEVVYVHLEDKLFNADKTIDLTKGETAVITGLDGYSIPKTIQRFSYQKPK
ncbi:MAG: flavin reductase family protein [Flavobacteriales bacterium]